MANWNGWWAPGYTQAPSSGFQITYETGADGQQYAVITAASVPARTWATVTFSGVVPASNWAVGGQLMTYSATTMDFPYACEPPLPAYQTTTVADPSSETSVTLSNIGDAWPTNTQPAPTTGTPRSLLAGPALSITQLVHCRSRYRPVRPPAHTRFLSLSRMPVARPEQSRPQLLSTRLFKMSR